MNISSLLSVLLLAAVELCPAAIRAKPIYPNHAVRIIVPLAAGSGTDIMARALAEQLSKRLNGTFVVDDRPGVDGEIGTEYVARASNDGYTLLMGGNTTHSANPYLFKQLPYNPIRDFLPVARLVKAGAVLVVSAKSDVHSVADLVKIAKERPKGTNYGAPDAGSQIAGERINQLAAIRMLRVPYRTVSQAITDVIAGAVTCTFAAVPAALPSIKAGQLRALAQTTSSRSPLLSDVPTLQEAGFANLDVTYWSGLFLPAGASEEIADILDGAVANVMFDKQMNNRLARLGLDSAYIPRAQMKAFVQSELDKWGRLIHQAGIEPN